MSHQHVSLLQNSNKDHSHNTSVIKTPTTKPNVNKHQQKEKQKESHVEEIIEQRFSSMFEEMDVDDPLRIDLNEDEWLNCCYLKLSLTVATIIAAFVGGIIGIVITLNSNISEGWYKIIIFPGSIWIRALKLLVLPLISLIMVVLPSRVDEVASIGKQCIPLYLFTSICASIQGSIWGWTIRPGDHGQIVEETDTETETDITSNVSELDAFLEIANAAIPENIIVSMKDLSVLGIIIFCLCLGILLRSIQIDEKIIVLKFCRALLKCTMKAIVFVIWFTPIAMMSLIAAQLAYTTDLPGLLTSLGVFVAALMCGQIIHVFIFYPLLYFFTTRNSIFEGYRFLKKIYEAPLLAFATASSAATLPRSLLVAQKAGISKQVYQFIIPLGAAINMDGTALTYPINIALIAQLHNIELSIGVICVIALLAVVVSVGTAPVPNAGLAYILMLLKVAGLEEYETETIATLFVVEWLNGRLQTMVNVTSDQFVAKICDDLNIKANKKQSNIYCGCCIGTKHPCIYKPSLIIKEQEMDQLV